MRSARLANITYDRLGRTLLPKLLHTLGFDWADAEFAAKQDLLMDYRKQKRFRRKVFIMAFVLLFVASLAALYRFL
jgi:hypothetical protein